LIYFLPLSSVNLPCICFSHSMPQISCPFSSALVTYPKTQSRSEALCHTLEEAYFLWWGLVSPMTNLQSEGPPLVGHSWLLIQYICSYPPYPQAVSYICNLRTCHDDKNSPNMLMFINSLCLCLIIHPLYIPFHHNGVCFRLCYRCWFFITDFYTSYMFSDSNI
jgi:hypothetical protein